MLKHQTKQRLIFWSPSLCLILQDPAHINIFWRIPVCHVCRRRSSPDLYSEKLTGSDAQSPDAGNLNSNLEGFPWGQVDSSSPTVTLASFKIIKKNQQKTSQAVLHSKTDKFLSVTCADCYQFGLPETWSASEYLSLLHQLSTAASCMFLM